MVEHKWIEASLKAFKKVMVKNQIPFWLEYGTQLGAVRDGKIIPYDLDGDVGVWIDDVEEMKMCQKQFESVGIMMAYQPNHIFVNYKINDKQWLATLDVYIFDVKKYKGKQWVVRIENGEVYDVRSPYHYYAYMDSITFLGEDFPIPWKAEQALEFAYGKEWKIPIKKPGVQIMLGKPTPEQLNKMGRTHHKKLEDL